MKLIIPMAGRGKRLRPHTLTLPKPLIPIAGKSIVQRLVEEITKLTSEPITEIGFVIGDFGKQTEQKLISIAEAHGAKGSIHYQLDPQGTAHAILCAADLLVDQVIVAYADTLFESDFQLNTQADSIIWTKQVNNPEQFGVVEIENSGLVKAFHEKPEKFVSDNAIIGIYFFKDGKNLKSELQYLLDQGIKTGGEYGITDALQNMLAKGKELKIETVNQWLDCGNKEAILNTNSRILEMKKDKETLLSETSQAIQSIIIPPCYIGADVILENSVIGPYVSIGNGSTIANSRIEECLIQENCQINSKVLHNSMIGNDVIMQGTPESFSLGDFNQVS